MPLHITDRSDTTKKLENIEAQLTQTALKIESNDVRGSQKILKVLLAAPGILDSVGGGQSFYQRLIEAYKDVHFYVLSSVKLQSVPSNVRVIDFQQPYRTPKRELMADNFKAFGEPASLALNIAFSVQGMHFDIVDYPDYLLFGVFGRSAFDLFNVKSEKFVLSLHGRLSDSFSRSWDYKWRSHRKVHEIRELEIQQLKTADIRYGISPAYVQASEQIAGLPCHLLDPKQVLAKSDRNSAGPKPNVKFKPDLFFIGRLEKLKGIEVAIDLIAMLPRHLQTPLNIIGPDQDAHGTKASLVLREYGRLRGVEVIYHGPLPQDEIKRLLDVSSIALLPSRYDTLNLVAWETLTAETPTFVGEGAGIASYLRSELPDLKFDLIEFSNLVASARRLREVIENFDSERKLLTSFWNSDRSVCNYNLKAIYKTSSSKDAKVASKAIAAFNALNEIYSTSRLTASRILRARVVKFAKRMLKRKSTRMLGRNLRKIKRALIGFFKLCLGKTSNYAGVKERVRILQSLKAIKGSKSFDAKAYFFRCQLYRLRAFAAAAIGRYDVAAAYALRIQRWSGIDLIKTELILEWLQNAGFHQEADAAEVMLLKPENIGSYLESRISTLKSLKQPVFEVFVDERETKKPRVSVIVSAFRVSDKIAHFAKLLRNQSISRDDVELIIIDSGSPDGSNHVQSILDACRAAALPFVLARTAERETIQAAWNRGISLTRADYITFLGVDESLMPQALEKLADHLDQNPSVDWAMGNSVVTEVAPDGEWLKDILYFDRSTASRRHLLLDCTYLGYVGGMYRKRIHEVCGYYDESFFAAGDTEFKNRAMQFINIGYLPELLGVFLNYPEVRVTESPRAEIEDLRAWYIFRTPEGLLSTTNKFADYELADLFSEAACYHKAYGRHWSSDFDLMTNLRIVLSARKIAHSASLAKLAAKIQRNFCSMEKAEGYLERLLSYFRLRISLRLARRLANAPSNEKCWLLCDNRFEQHSNDWKF